MKQVKKRRCGGRGVGVCIRERLGVTSHSSPAAGGPDTVNTQRGIGGRWEAGSYRVEQKGSIPSVKAVRTTGAVSHIDSMVCTEWRYSDSPLSLNGGGSWDYLIAEGNVVVRGRKKWDCSLSPASQQFMKAFY